MFDAPVDAWYVWLGVAVVSLAAMSVAVGLPSAAPPNAVAVADAIDGVATSPPGSMTTHAVDADEVRLDRRRIGLRGPGGTTHASVALGSITSAMADQRLERVVDGESPAAVFDSPNAFEETTTHAHEAEAAWRPAPERIVVRRVSWEGTDVVLVG